MKAYADTNFFTRFYVPNPDVPRLSRMIAAYLKRENEPLSFTPVRPKLLRMVAAFTGGVFVAGGDFDRDGFGDVLTGADAGAASHAKVFDGQTNAEDASFFAYGAGFTGGVRVGAGDINGDGAADIITGAGSGAPGGHIKVFDGLTGAEIRSFFSYTGFDGGVYVAGLAERIPEPSAVALLLLAGASLCRRGRRSTAE